MQALWEERMGFTRTLDLRRTQKSGYTLLEI
jgi:hypothetical protein